MNTIATKLWLWVGVVGVFLTGRDGTSAVMAGPTYKQDLPTTTVLPGGMEGVWKGRATSTILGPLGVDQVFVVQRLSDGSGFLVSDVFGALEVIPDSWQRFYVQNPPAPGAPAVLTYCGMLGRWYNSIDIVPDLEGIRFLMTLASSTPTSALFTATGVYPLPEFDTHNITFSYELTLVSVDTLRLHVKFDEADHLLVTLQRTTDKVPLLNNPPGSRTADGGHTCDLNATSLPSQVVHPWVPESVQSRTLPKAPPPFECPMRRGRRRHPHQRAQPPMHAAAPHSAVPQPGDRVCYIVQAYANMNLSWTIPRADDTTIAITVAAEVPQAGTGVYLALGFPSAVPTMANMSIAAALNPASGASTVVSLFAASPFGAPEPDKGGMMPLTHTATTRRDTVMTLSFTRRLDTKFAPIVALPRNITTPFLRPHVYFATGPLADDGADTASIAYHGHTRGMFGVDWFYPDRVWSPSRQC